MPCDGENCIITRLRVPEHCRSAGPTSSFTFESKLIACSHQIGLDMTMQRSEYTDPDSSRRFPVVSSTSRSLISAGATVDPATELSGQAAGPATAAAAAAATASATATDACHADVLSGRGKSYTKHYGNLRFDGTCTCLLRSPSKNATMERRKRPLD